MESVVLRDGNFHPLIAKVTEKAGSKQALWNVLGGYYKVCFQSVITEFTMHMWQLYQFTNGLSNETYATFVALPIKVVEAVNVIKSEVNRVEQLRANGAKAKAAILMASSKGRSHG